jgi:hypothetical protein
MISKKTKVSCTLIRADQYGEMIHRSISHLSLIYYQFFEKALNVLNIVRSEKSKSKMNINL